MSDNPYPICKNCMFADEPLEKEPCRECNQAFLAQRIKPNFVSKRKLKTNANRLRAKTDTERSRLDETGDSRMRLTYWNDRKGHFDWHCENNEIADKLATYEDAEEKGLLIRLPCKLGDTVYHIVSHTRHTVDVTGYCMEWKLVTTIEPTVFRIWMVDAVGKTVFLTREEAEAALKSKDEQTTFYEKEN